jgi:LPS-assembly lipoprotein
MSVRLPRRALGSLALVALLPGCGFHPLYARSSGGSMGPAEAGLAETTVGLIPERFGQLLQQALQARFERGGTGVARRYDLSVAAGLSAEGIAIQSDSSATYTRLVGTATWTLTAQDPQRRTLSAGAARTLDGFNIVNNQLFNSDLQNEAVQRRMTEALADQITMQVASYFNRQAKAS